MSIDSARATISALWSPLLAITTSYQGRDNGQIAVGGLSASILHEAPRVVIELWKANLTHDLVLASGVFALHLLDAALGPLQTASIDIVHILCMRSGHNGDKMASLEYTHGTTGSPILTQTLSYVEGRVIRTLDGDELTIFLAEVVAGATLHTGEMMTTRHLRTLLPAEWQDEWQQNQAQQQSAARQWRGLSL